MNTARILSYALVAVAAGAGGYFFGNRAEEPSSTGNKVKAESNGVEMRKGTGGGLPAGLAKIVGDSLLTGANAGPTTFRALEVTDPVQRMAAVSLMLESMTPANAREIYQAFLDITTKTGRRHDAEWALMLNRYGEVLGTACFEQLLPEPANLALAIEGWAAVDPDGVLKAIKGANVQDSRYDSAWLAGICRSDPAKAFSMALAGNYATLDGTKLINQAIHTLGMDGARDALQKALDSPAGENVAGSPVFQGLFNSLADAMFHKNATEGTPGPMLKWLEQQKGQPYITPAIVERAVHDGFLRGDPAEATVWLERMNEGNQGETTGGRGIFLAVFEKPDILTKIDDATFKRVLQLLPKSASESFRSLAVMIAQTNPARAEQLRQAAPPEVPVGEP